MVEVEQISTKALVKTCTWTEIFYILNALTSPAIKYAHLPSLPAHMKQVALVSIGLVTGYSPLSGVLWSFPVVPRSMPHTSHNTVQSAALKLKHVSCFGLSFPPLPHCPCGECSLLDLTQENRNAHAEISAAIASSGCLWGEDGLLLSCLFSLPHWPQGYVTPNPLHIFSGIIQSNIILTNLLHAVSELGPEEGGMGHHNAVFSFWPGNSQPTCTTCKTKTLMHIIRSVLEWDHELVEGGVGSLLYLRH